MSEEPNFDTSNIDALAAAETGESLILKPSADVLTVEQPVTLEELFHELHALAWTLEDECRSVNEVISMMQEKIAAKEEEYAPRMRELEEKIKAEILNQKKPFKCDWGTATHRKGRTTISWNDDALRGYAVDHAEILKFRTEKTGEPSVTIKVGYQV